ncbi:hypothetical protein EV643_1013 [Kribbella sp. VKM Ac-2527]|uniref:Uncharacterized protein n=1 Tax=Kribbella caucasensis TaxID=2512215 RepID=A0A4R6KNN3_9ACTN|nr:hypothetical protein EV643_1013 [Kribbella sp. VKM Ac-2527]
MLVQVEAPGSQVSWKREMPPTRSRVAAIAPGMTAALIGTGRPATFGAAVSDGSRYAEEPQHRDQAGSHFVGQEREQRELVPIGWHGSEGIPVGAEQPRQPQYAVREGEAGHQPRQQPHGRDGHEFLLRSWDSTMSPEVSRALRSREWTPSLLRVIGAGGSRSERWRRRRAGCGGGGPR